MLTFSYSNIQKNHQFCDYDSNFPPSITDCHIYITRRTTIVRAIHCQQSPFDCPLPLLCWTLNLPTSYLTIYFGSILMSLASLLVVRMKKWGTMIPVIGLAIPPHAATIMMTLMTTLQPSQGYWQWECPWYSVKLRWCWWQIYMQSGSATPRSRTN